MLCPNCSKLTYQYLNKKCLRCQGGVLNTISIICETCSARDKQCSACLKKVDNSAVKKNYYGGCGACRK
jgi:hypothetical protein